MTDQLKVDNSDNTPPSSVFLVFISSIGVYLKMLKTYPDILDLITEQVNRQRNGTTLSAIVLLNSVKKTISHNCHLNIYQSS